MKSSSLSSLLMVVFVLLVALPACGQEPPAGAAPAGAAAYMDELEGAFNGAIALSGRVEDEAGRPLERVRLKVRESRFDPDAESFSASSTESRMVDGWFEVSCQDCDGLSLRFSKKGYYSENLELATDRSEPTEDGVIGKAGDVSESHLRVVLGRIENEATLVRYQSTLTSAADGPVTVAPMKRDLSAGGVKLERLREIALKSNEPMRYVRLVPAVAESGALAEKAAPATPGSVARLPAPVVLDFSEAGGGVVLFRLARGNPRDIYRAMRTAPEEGYQESIVLEPTKDGSYYFYCRIGDSYGKGMVGQPSFGYAVDGREVTQAYIEIRLNPDGSRNLETAR
ncbi:MAG: hypothetical protein GY719_35630 [bacterium]|nr:hypothetical protein [bacterium]